MSETELRTTKNGAAKKMGAAVFKNENLCLFLWSTCPQIPDNLKNWTTQPTNTTNYVGPANRKPHTFGLKQTKPEQIITQPETEMTSGELTLFYIKDLY